MKLALQEEVKVKLEFPCVLEIEYEDPITLYRHFANEKFSVLLDGALHNDLGRYSYIGIDPFYVSTADKFSIENPLHVLQKKLLAFQLEKLPNLPPFQGGVVGFFAYDFSRHFEQIQTPFFASQMFPEMVVAFYDLIIGFDHVRKRAWIFSSGYPEQQLANRLKRASKRLQSVAKIIATHATINYNSAVCNKISSNFTKKSYMEAVNKVKEYIYEGDIFEANISQQFTAILPEDLKPFDVYQRLRKLNPAAMAAYFNAGDMTIASASPELFLNIKNKIVETRPIKGTRARATNKQDDEKIKYELINNEKDCAENIMIVDLLRNDLSRVCKDNTVRVEKLCHLESHATVHHLVSTITAELLDEKNMLDLLTACFPGGSITGAPKIRAMEIIAEIEQIPRGPYCGTLACMGFDGDMNSSLLIRTFAFQDRTVTFSAGGAVVLDSDPLSEYEETLSKTKALHEALLQP